MLVRWAFLELENEFCVGALPSHACVRVSRKDRGWGDLAVDFTDREWGDLAALLHPDLVCTTDPSLSAWRSTVCGRFDGCWESRHGGRVASECFRACSEAVASDRRHPRASERWARPRTLRVAGATSTGRNASSLPPGAPVCRSARHTRRRHPLTPLLWPISLRAAFLLPPAAILLLCVPFRPAFSRGPSARLSRTRWPLMSNGATVDRTTSPAALSHPSTSTMPLPVGQRAVGLMPDPYAALLSPLVLPGAPPAPPQLIGSLPFSPPADTIQFGAPFRPAFLGPAPDVEPLATGHAGAGVPNEFESRVFSDSVVASMDPTQQGRMSTALLSPVVANDGPDPLRHLLNDVTASTAPAPATRSEPPRPATRAFVRTPFATLPGVSTPIARGPTNTAAPPPLPRPPMIAAGRRRGSAPAAIRVGLATAPWSGGRGTSDFASSVRARTARQPLDGRQPAQAGRNGAPLGGLDGAFPAAPPDARTAAPSAAGASCLASPVPLSAALSPACAITRPDCVAGTSLLAGGGSLTQQRLAATPGSAS